jgi:hypothetical protein
MTQAGTKQEIEEARTAGKSQHKNPPAENSKHKIKPEFECFSATC